MSKGIKLAQWFLSLDFYHCGPRFESHFRPDPRKLVLEVTYFL